MPTDPIDTAVAKAKTSKSRWLWGSLAVAFGVWLLFWWVSSHRSAMILPDGTVISYAGVHKGKRVNDTDFERDVYAYPCELVSPTPLTERLNRLIESLVHPRRGRYANYNEYSSAPELLMFHVSGSPSSKEDFRVVLDDSFGEEQLMSNGYSGSSPIRLNREQLPMGSPTWKVKVRGPNNQALGELVLPNPLFKSTPRFVGNSPPLESRTSKGVLRLLSANYSVGKEGESTGCRYVTLTFDTSACPDLLPCHVIGVRVTDSWGNTGLIDGSLESDGKTIRAQWCKVPGVENSALQSEDWHIKIAICRGYGASFANDDIAVFDHFLATPDKQAPCVRTIAGQQLTLQEGWVDDSRPSLWRLCRFEWELDQKGSLLWPILVKATGRTAEGAVVEINSIKSERPHERSNYWVTRERLRYGCNNSKLADATLFEAGFMSPPGLKDFDLHIALEEPQVFEFSAKVSNWPTVPSEKK